MKSKLTFLLFLVTIQAFSQVGAPQLKPVDSAAKPVLLWKFKTNGPVVSSPVINNGTVYVGSLDSSLYALDLSTGKLKWRMPSGGAIRSSVCISGKWLYQLSSDGLLCRMDIDSGMVKGVFHTMNGSMGDHQNDYADYFTSTPVIVDSTIFFGSGDKIYAISITDGYLRWTYQTGGLVHTTPAIMKNLLYAGSFDGYLYAVDIKTGGLAWKFKTTGISSFPKGEVTGNPVVAGQMVIAGARDFNLYAVDARGGFTCWMKQFPAGWALPVMVNDSVIYVGTSDDRSLFAFDLRNGREVWKADAGFNILGGCAIRKNIGYFGTLAGKVHGIDLKTGKISWTIELEGYKAKRYFYLKPDDSYRLDIYKIVKTPLDMLTMYRDLGGVFGTPALSGNSLVVAGYDGWVYCFMGETKK
jgi:eukaryotic-like serine/threonine-protein kinase